MGWFRKSAAEPLAVTMAGVKRGDRLLVVGVGNPAFIAALAVKSGLTGRACAVDADQARIDQAGPAIEREGGLAEVARAPWDALPYDPASIDVAVISHVLLTLPEGTGARARTATEILRVVRPGGRAIVIEHAPGGADAMRALQTAGFAAVRELAVHKKVSYVEGVKRAG